MLTKLRSKVAPAMNSIGTYLARLGLKPNHLTAMAVTLSMLMPIIAYFNLAPNYFLPLLLAVSAILDALDGAVARASGLKSLFGSFLDSVCDRVSDAAYALTLALLGINYVIVFLFAISSFMISYMRAKAESLGLKMEGVGLMERGDRVIILLIILILITLGKTTYASYLLTLALLLCLITIVHRGVHTWRNLKSS